MPSVAATDSKPSAVKQEEAERTRQGFPVKTLQFRRASYYTPPGFEYKSGQ